MPNTKEKLVELIGQVQDEGCDYSNCLDRYDKPDYIENSTLADHLVAHGVTVQEWISVKNRLPDNICPVLVALEGLSIAFYGWYQNGEWWTVGGGTRIFAQKVTHWMHMPQPPKGE